MSVGGGRVGGGYVSVGGGRVSVGGGRPCECGGRLCECGEETREAMYYTIIAGFVLLFKDFFKGIISGL